MQKECACCKQTKSKDDFYKDKKGTLGLRASCKECECNKRKEKQALAQMKKHIATKKRGREEEPSNMNEDNVEMSGGPKYQKDDDDIDPNDFPEVEHDYPFFDFEQKFVLGKHYSNFYLASRNSGKTYLIKHLWPFFKTRYDIQIFFCNSFNAPIYSEFLLGNDWLTCFDEYNSDLIWDILDFQKQTKNLLNLHVLMDDCSDEHSIKNSKALLQLFTRGRNSAISISFSSQSPTLLSRVSRNNVDYVFLLRIRNPKMRVTVMEEFLMGYVPFPPEYKLLREKEEYLEKWMKVNTAKRNIAVIDAVNNDKIYRYRAP